MVDQVLTPIDGTHGIRQVREFLSKHLLERTFRCKQAITHQNRLYSVMDHCAVCRKIAEIVGLLCQ